MNKVVKIVLNLACGVGIGALGYRLGYKKGVEETKEWAAGEINTILDCKAEALVNEKEAEMTPDLLKKMEFGKADEVVITKDPLENQILPEQDEIVVEVKPNKVDIPSEAPKRSRKKLPYMVTCTEFDENFNDMTRKELELTQMGDLYVGCSDELYSARTFPFASTAFIPHEAELRGVSDAIFSTREGSPWALTRISPATERIARETAVMRIVFVFINHRYIVP